MRMAAAVMLSVVMIFVCAFPASAFTIIYDGKTEDYPWDPITMVVDGTVVETEEMPPIILNGRTLVPAREFFEQLGAEVNWDQNTRRVTVEYNGVRIIMTIDLKTVFVGDNSVMISDEDPAPKIINDKTMIPVRFVAEELGFNVEWVNSTRSVVITSPNTETVTVSSVVFGSNDADELFVTMDGIVEPDIFMMQNPFRVVIDFYGAQPTMKDGSITADGSAVSKIRYSRHDDRFRIVADMKCGADIEVEDHGNGILITFIPTGAEEPTEEETQVPSDTEISGMTVVVDAGHGGSDPGAIYPAESSNPSIREKDVTLAIALKVRDSLKAKGVNVIMTRDGDTYPTLQERVEIANASGADLFVSIHCNSMANKDEIDGAQVYYFGSSVFGKKFATIVYNNIIEYTDMTERGIQDGSTLYVIKNTVMPAILTEGGFVSNAKDREYLLSDEGQTAIAKAISDGVAEALKLL